MPANGLASNNDLRLIIACFLLWFYCSAFLMLAIEATNRWTAFFLAAAPVGTFVLVKKFAIPPVSDEAADEVLGHWKEMVGDEVYFSDVQDGLKKESSPSSAPTISVWAHRFAGLDAPENTLEALETCLKNGAKAVEFDLVLTADLVPVVFHDVKLDRLTNCEADIRQLPWSEVKTFDVSANHPFRSKFSETHIPLFEDVLKMCIANKTHMVIDIKDDRIEAVQAVVDAFNKNPELYKLALCSSFNPFIIFNRLLLPYLLAALGGMRDPISFLPPTFIGTEGPTECLRKADPSIVTGLTYRPYYMTCSKYSPNDSESIPYPLSAPMFYIYRIADYVHRYVYDNLCHSVIGFSIALLEKNLITREVIYRWKKQNVRVMAWTVNIPLEKAMFIKSYGVPIVTDSMLGHNDHVQ